MSITDELREYATNDSLHYCSDYLAIADRIDAEHEQQMRERKGCIHYDQERHYCNVHDLTTEDYKRGYDDSFASADDWLAQHEDAMTEHGWIRLPKDADGEYIHVGDVVVAQLLSGGESKPLVVDRMELSRGRDGDLWCVALDNDKECWNMPSILRHHHPPTIDDVLREFAEKVIDSQVPNVHPTYEEAIAEYSAKLRLRGDAE